MVKYPCFTALYRREKIVKVTVKTLGKPTGRAGSVETTPALCLMHNRSRYTNRHEICESGCKNKEINDEEKQTEGNKFP